MARECAVKYQSNLAMSNTETQRAEHAILRRCSRCGERHAGMAEASVCCLFAPEPLGWCAWCGTDLPGAEVFCGPACALDHATDLTLAWPKHRAPSPPS